ncbi:Uncharacterised protein [Mycobacterium tuberculosis]|nr:Uncharacterised protein [Mycobacterium tuberculosis]
MSEVGGDGVRAAAAGADLLGDRVQFGLGARSNHNVGPYLGERQRDGRTEAAAATGDDGDLVVEAELVEDHVRPFFFSCRKTLASPGAQS